MLPPVPLKRISFCVLCYLITSTIADVASIFQRPVYARIYNGEQYSLAEADRSTGNRVNISEAASAIAGLRPTYVCSLIYLGHGDNLTQTMVGLFLSALYTDSTFPVPESHEKLTSNCDDRSTILTASVLRSML